MNKSVFSFCIAYQSEEELKALQEQKEADPNSLVLTILPDGQPSYKTLYTLAETEEEAFQKVDAFVKCTPYRDIPNNKVI